MSVVQGYGICISDVVAGLPDEELADAFASFIKGTSVEREWNKFVSENKYSSMWNGINCFGYDEYDCPGDIFAQVLYEKTGVRFAGTADYDNYWYVLYRAVYSWEMTDSNKKIKYPQDIDKLFKHEFCVFSPRGKIYCEYHTVENDG